MARKVTKYVYAVFYMAPHRPKEDDTEQAKIPEGTMLPGVTEVASTIPFTKWESVVELHAFLATNENIGQGVVVTGWELLRTERS